MTGQSLIATMAAERGMRPDELDNARQIIAGLKAFREFALTKAVSADEINVLLSEHTDIDNGPFVAVQIATLIDAKLQDFDLNSPYPENS